MQRACLHLKPDPDTRQRCLAGQVTALRESGSAPSLQELSETDRVTVQQACKHLFNAGPGHYSGCLKRELKALAAGPPSLDDVPPAERLGIRVSCSQASKFGPSTHNECLASEVQVARASTDFVKSLPTEEQTRVLNTCAARRTAGPTAHFECLKTNARPRAKSPGATPDKLPQ
jgi:hypothetical protein